MSEGVFNDEPIKPLTREEIVGEFNSFIKFRYPETSDPRIKYDLKVEPEVLTAVTRPHRQLDRVKRERFAYDRSKDSFYPLAQMTAEDMDTAYADKSKSVQRYSEQPDKHGWGFVQESLKFYALDGKVTMMFITLHPDVNNTYHISYLEEGKLGNTLHTAKVGEPGTKSFEVSDFFIPQYLEVGEQNVASVMNREYTTTAEEDPKTKEQFIVLDVKDGDDITHLRFPKILPEERAQRVHFDMFPSFKFDEDPYNVDPRDDKWVSANWKGNMGVEIVHSVPVPVVEPKDLNDTQDQLTSK